MLKIKTLTEALLIAFILRLIVKGASLGDSYVVASLCGVWAYQLYLEKLQIVDTTAELGAELRKRLVVVEEKTKQHDSKFAAQIMTGRSR